MTPRAYDKCGILRRKYLWAYGHPWSGQI